MSYADLDAAREAIGGHVRSVLEITLTDYAGNRPTGDWWTETKTLHLCGGEPFLRTASPVEAGFWYYEPLVKDWGKITQECQIGQAFGNISDVLITLHNRPLAAQQNNSTYTFASGSAAMDPEPEMVKLSELFHFYNFHSATVVIKTLYFCTADTDQSTAANFKSRTIFNGFIQGVDISSDEISLDITQDRTMQDTILPGRILSDAIDKNIQSLRAPIIYGNFFEHFESVGSADEVNGFTVPQAVAAGIFQPTVAAALPWKRDPNHPLGDATYLFYLYNDTKGRNSGWIGQEGHAGKTNNDDTVFLYNDQAQVWTLTTLGTAPGNAGEIFWPNLGSGSEEDFVTNVDYVEGETYIPCSSVFDSGVTAGTLSDEEKLFDGDPYTHCLFPVENTANYLDLRIPDVGNLGQIVNEANAVRAFILVDGSTVSTSTAINFGLYVPNISEPIWWGDAGSPPGGSAYYGVLSESGGSIAKQFKDQNTNSVDIGSTAYFPTDSFTHVISRWEWKGSNWYDDGGGAAHHWGDLVVRIQPGTAGGSGEQLKIIAAGIIVKNIPNFIATPERRVTVPFPSYAHHRESLSRSAISNAFSETFRPAPDELIARPWIMQAETTLDDGSGTLTGTADDPITSPGDIATHLLLKWGDGVASSDVETASSTFGSTQDWDTEWNTWRLGGTSNHCQLVINREQTMDKVLGDFAAQFPMMLYREVGDDKVLMGFYPEDTTNTNRYSTTVDFHPNIDHPDADDYAKPYIVQDVRVHMTDLDQIFNRFKLRYRRFAPTNDLSQSFVVTETPNDSNVLDTSSNLSDGRPRDEPGGYNPSAVCATSQLRYSVKRWLTVDAPSLHSHDVAYAFMHYLIKRFTQPRLIVQATGGPEFIDLKPGHIITFSDDLNLEQPIPDYGSGAAKLTGWRMTGATGDPHKDFLVHRIERTPSDYGCDTTFVCEQIMYNPRGSFWTPADISTGTVAEHLRTQDITGLSDGDAIGDAADWTANVGTDGSQPTAAQRPTYESASGDLQNGYPIARWAGGAGNNDGIVITGYTAPTGNYVMGYVFNANSTSGTQTLYRSQTNTPIIQIASGGNVNVFDGGGVATIGSSATGKQVLIIKADSTDGIEVWRNGTSIGTDGTYTAETPAGAQILGNRHLYDQGCDMDLYEVVIINYASDVDDDEVTRLEGYLAHEWGLESSLPTSHAYRYAPPTNG